MIYLQIFQQICQVERKTREIVGLLLNEEDLLTKDAEKAELCNAYFEPVFAINKIPVCKLDPDH